MLGAMLGVVEPLRPVKLANAFEISGLANGFVNALRSDLPGLSSSSPARVGAREMSRESGCGNETREDAGLMLIPLALMRAGNDRGAELVLALPPSASRLAC